MQDTQLMQKCKMGKLYDALYGTDLIPEEDQTSKGNNYNPKRVKK